MPRLPKRETEQSEGVVQSDTLVAVEVDEMSVRAKLACIEGYESSGHVFLTRTFKDLRESFVEVFVFRKPDDARFAFSAVPELQTKLPGT